MKKGYRIVIGTILAALGFVSLLITTLSPATAAPDVSLSKAIGFHEEPNEGWRILADMQHEQGFPGVATLDDKIHVIGGTYPYGELHVHEVYDPQTDTWQYLKALPVPRSDLMVANVGDKLYAIGGWDGEIALGFTHMYDPQADTWYTRTSMITPVSGAGVVVYSDTIYIIGGYAGLENLSLVQIYDPEENSWDLGTPLPVGRAELGAVILNGQIYAIGGNRSDNDGDGNPTSDIVEVYDPIADIWSNGPALPDSRAAKAVVVRQGKIYVIGGTDNWAIGENKDTMFVYDPGTGKWSTAAPMPTARAMCNAAVIGDLIFVVGGYKETGKANEAFGYPITFTYLPIMLR